MALPLDWTTVTIKGKYVNFLGVPGVGKVIFTPTAPHIKHIASDLIIFAKPVEAVLGVEGEFEIDLLATDDPDVEPTFAYDVVEEITGATRRQYVIEVPVDLKFSEPFDLSDLVPIGTAPTSGGTYLTKATADALYVASGEVKSFSVVTDEALIPVDAPVGTAWLVVSP